MRGGKLKRNRWTADDGVLKLRFATIIFLISFNADVTSDAASIFA